MRRRRAARCPATLPIDSENFFSFVQYIASVASAPVRPTRPIPNLRQKLSGCMAAYRYRRAVLENSNEDVFAFMKSRRRRRCRPPPEPARRRLRDEAPPRRRFASIGAFTG